MTNNTKKCTSCGIIKGLQEFTKASGGNYYRSKCKKCECAKTKIRKELKKLNPPPSCDNHRCLICKRSADECANEGNANNGPFVLDHDPTTNKFRGYLCHTCNRSLGGFKDSILLLNNAIDYLNNAQHVDYTI